MNERIIKKGERIKILKPDDFIMLENTFQYKEQVDSECQLKLEDTARKCEIMQADLNNSYIEQLKKVSDQLYQDNMHLANELMGLVENNLTVLINKVVNKLQLLNILPEQISQVIKTELLNLIYDKCVIIYCHSSSIEQLKEMLLDTKITINYVIDEKLLPGQCVLEDSLAKIYIDLADCRDKINMLLNYTDSASA